MFYKHIKTGKIYVVLGECNMKNPQTREWVNAYRYSPVVDNTIMETEYVREVSDFHQRFKRVKAKFKE